jgi:hypothetical protein
MTDTTTYPLPTFPLEHGCGVDAAMLLYNLTNLADHASVIFAFFACRGLRLP